MSASYALRPLSHEESVAWLKRKLGAPGHQQKPRAPERLRVLGTVPREELQEGLEVLVLFADRSRCPRVGRIAAVRRWGLTLWWWGVDRNEYVPFADVLAIRMIGEHSWNTFHAVSAAQRRGECAPHIQGRDRRARP